MALSEGNDEKISDQKTYGLKSSKTPPVVKELVAFEEDLWKLVTRLRFRRVNCEFQNKLREDIKSTKKSKKVYVSADKTSNIYKTPKEQYENLLTNAVTSCYKKAKPKLADEINNLGIKFAKNKGVQEKMLQRTGEASLP